MAIDPKKILPPTRFDQPKEKLNWKKLILLCGLVLAAVGAGIWMVKQSPHQHALTCSSSGMGSWSSFGRCTED